MNWTGRREGRGNHDGDGHPGPLCSPQRPGKPHVFCRVNQGFIVQESHSCRAGSPGWDQSCPLSPGKGWGMDAVESIGCGAPAPSEQGMNLWSPVRGFGVRCDGCGIVVGFRTRQGVLPSLPWGQIPSRNVGVPLPSPSAWPQGHWALSQPCRDVPAAPFWHPGAGHHWSLAQGSTRSTRFWHPGTEYHQNLVSQGIPLQQVTVCWRDGAEVALHQQQDGSRARPSVPEAKLPPGTTSFPFENARSLPVLQHSSLSRLCCPKHWFRCC